MDKEPQQSTSTGILHQKTVDSFLLRKVPHKTKEMIDRKLLNLFIKDLQPFSVVEDSGFKEFISALNPGYQLPSRYVISNTLLPALYEQCLTDTRNLVATGKTFCLTTDAWTSINATSYVAFTAHFLDANFQLRSVLLECSASDLPHTSANLSSELNRVVHEWGIEDKIILAVSDNASNVQKALKELGWEHLGCIAHTINLIVKDGLKHQVIQTIIEKVRTIVKHFRRSNKANEKLVKYQQNLGKAPLKLLLEVATRWNSCFYMLQRCVELEEAMKSTLAIIDRDLPILTATEWTIIKELCLILKPFEDVTKTLSGSQYCTAALVIPMFNGLKRVFEKLTKKNFSQPVKDVVEHLKTSLHERLGSIEKNNTFSISTFLDPKFKNIGFSDKSNAEETNRKIISLIAENIERKTCARGSSYTAIETLDDDEVESIDDEKISIWMDFDKTVAESQPKGTSSSRTTIEMQRYMEEDILPRNGDSLLWWREHSQMLPHLSELAQERLCCLATSVP